ncbi:hypothetical protein [Azospira sp.]|uniref:hypothetical protein n=1 Tax=Azospira sp. TaxID=1872671 RepID=UPI002569B049|nr:hypothetical protein [Azospira sp.]MDK9689976.1 hypothetical protein [Azospira sp.]
MNQKPLWLPLAEVIPGTPLAADLADGEGQLLLTAGSRLDAHRLQQLARQGIATVPVPPPPPPPTPEEIARREGEARLRMERRFTHAGHGQASRALFQVLLQRQLEMP